MMWPTKKKLKLKKMASQCHIGEVYSIYFFFFYKGANQTENFTRVKTGNDIYYKGEKHYQPFI